MLICLYYSANLIGRTMLFLFDRRICGKMKPQVRRESSRCFMFLITIFLSFFPLVEAFPHTLDLFFILQNSGKCAKLACHTQSEIPSLCLTIMPYLANLTKCGTDPKWEVAHGFLAFIFLHPALEHNHIPQMVLPVSFS